jgi:hypothetical protein
MVKLDDPSQSVNTCGPYRIQYVSKKVYRNGKNVDVFDPYRLKIVGGTKGFSPYIRGGMLTQHKQPFRTEFRAFAETLVRCFCCSIYIYIGHSLNHFSLVIDMIVI